jgi:hypothetical protein
VDKPHVSAAREFSSVIGERTRRDDQPACCTLGGHHTVQLADHGHADLECPPLLALNEKFVAVFAEHEVHSAISTTTARLMDNVSLCPKSLTNEKFEFLPGQDFE